MCAHIINKDLICVFMQSQRLLFKPADHNQLQPIQLLSTCNTWYQEKCARASANNAAIQTSTRCRLCAHASVCACRHAGWPAGYSPGWLVIMSDWLPAGFITLRQRQKQTLWPPHPQVSLSLFLLLSVSFCPSLFASQSDWAELWGECWLTLVLSGRPSCGEALWLKRQNKSSHCYLWSSCPRPQDGLTDDTHMAKKSTWRH